MTDFGGRVEACRFLAAVIIAVAEERNEPVTGMLVTEAMLEGLTRDPGTRFHDAAQAATYYEVSQAIMAQLDSAGRNEMVGQDLREAKPPEKTFKPYDRVVLQYSLNAGGTEYPKGASGVILELADPIQANEFAAVDEYPVRMDQGGILRVADVLLDFE